MPKTVVVRARVPVEIGDKIQAEAKNTGMTVSMFLRLVLAGVVTMEAKPKPKPAALSGQIGLFQ